MRLEDEILAWLEDLEGLGARGKGFRYPQQMQQRASQLVVRLREAGWTQQAISESLQVSWESLRRWSEPKAKSEAGFHRLQTQSPKSQELSLVAPNGWRIEGIELSTALELLAQLR